MHRFFVDAEAVSGGRATVRGADAAHLARSLRARPGERIVVVDACGVEHCVVLDAVDAAACTGTVEWSRPSEAEAALRVVVLQALPQQGMDEAVDAMTQVGVAAIVPVVTARTVVRLDPGRAARRVERWRAVAREAAALAGRAAIPEIAEVAGLAGALEGLARPRRLLVAEPGAPRSLAALGAIDDGLPIVLVVGPEGGLAPDEVDLAEAAGAERVALGPRILRARLAGAIAAAILLASAEAATGAG